MSLTGDPLQANEMLKSATIYRNSEYNYVYVCYHCERTFTNVLSTLTHVEETHFDGQDEVKVNIVNDKLGLEVDCGSRGYVSESSANQRPSTDCVVTDNSVVLSDGLKTGPGDMEIEIEYTIVEYQHSEQNVEDPRTDFTYKGQVNRCSLCDRRLNSAPLLIIHLLNDHAKSTSLKCPQCSQNFTDEVTFSSHLQGHIDRGDTTYDALIDRIEAEREVAIEFEVDNRPQRKAQKCTKVCDICSSTFSTKEQLIAHMKEQHIEKPEVKRFFFDCDKCERKVEGRFAFYAHQYGHLTNDDRVNDANDDYLQISLRKYLNDSVYYDDTTKTHGCRICNQIAVKDRYGAQRHIMQQHIYLIKEKKPKKFSCEYCGRKFALSNNLRVHQRIHTLEKPFKCPVCNKSFSQSSYMRYHEKIHLGLHPHQCSICGRTFRTNHKLNFHIKMHENITTKCPICDKELKEYRLKLHIRNVHENEHRPYQCEVCKMAFKTAKTLRTHSYRHNAEKQFECRHHCKEKFTSSSSRRAHERSKHEAP